MLGIERRLHKHLTYRPGAVEKAVFGVFFAFCCVLIALLLEGDRDLVLYIARLNVTYDIECCIRKYPHSLINVPRHVCMHRDQVRRIKLLLLKAQDNNSQNSLHTFRLMQIGALCCGCRRVCDHLCQPPPLHGRL